VRIAAAALLQDQHDLPGERGGQQQRGGVATAPCRAAEQPGRSGTAGQQDRQRIMVEPRPEDRDAGDRHRQPPCDEPPFPPVIGAGPVADQRDDRQRDHW
jgi:hypothetical protein